MVRCWSSSITAVMVLMLVAVTTIHDAPPQGSNSNDSCLFTKALYNCQIVESPNVSFPNASFNNVVVSFIVFFKHTHNLTVQHCSADTSIFSKHSVTHCLAIHECSSLYARLFFFLHVDCFTHLLLRSHVFYQPRKSFFPLSACIIVCHRGMLTCFQVTSYISSLVRCTVVGMRSLES